MISINRWWLGLILAVAMVGPAAAAAPDFSTSTASHEPAKVIAGDVVRYTVTVINTGGVDSMGSGYARVVTSLPRGYFIRADGDCATHAPDDDDRIVWHEGLFPAGAIKRCRIDLLTRRDAAGTLAPLVTEISTLPSGYLRVETAPELATAPNPNVIRIGPTGDNPRRTGRLRSARHHACWSGDRHAHGIAYRQRSLHCSQLVDCRLRLGRLPSLLCRPRAYRSAQLHRLSRDVLPGLRLDDPHDPRQQQK